jgi:tRNA pseudouridine55 synthase
MHGVLVIDKPAGRSSASAVDYVKKTLRADRAGHGGTLDPLATGVLAICLNAGTKVAQYLLADDKAYQATGILGVETDTLDRTGRITSERPVAITEAQLRELLASRRGEQQQVPPMFSAIKQDGVRSYHRARAGEEVELAPRTIRIDQLELVDLDLAARRFTIHVACSKGTYIRSLVADLGTSLGCGAHLTELRRTRSGRFTIEQAVRLEALPTLDLEAHLIRLADATDLRRVVANDAQLRLIRSGVQLPLIDLGGNPELFQVVDPEDRLVAIAHGVNQTVVYDRVFPEDATS